MAVTAAVLWLSLNRVKKYIWAILPHQTNPEGCVRLVPFTLKASSLLLIHKSQTGLVTAVISDSVRSSVLNYKSYVNKHKQKKKNKHLRCLGFSYWSKSWKGSVTLALGQTGCCFCQGISLEDSHGWIISFLHQRGQRWKHHVHLGVLSLLKVPCNIHKSRRAQENKTQAPLTLHLCRLKKHEYPA